MTTPAVGRRRFILAVRKREGRGEGHLLWDERIGDHLRIFCQPRPATPLSVFLGGKSYTLRAEFSYLVAAGIEGSTPTSIQNFSLPVSQSRLSSLVTPLPCSFPHHALSQ